MNRRRDSIASVSPINLESYIRSTERIIGSLKRDLDTYRSKSDTLSRDRSQQTRMMARLEATQRNHPGLESELRFLRAERDRVVHQTSTLKEERDDALDRCAGLERALEQLTVKYDEALEVISYLEAQIDSIESIVGLLKEHKRFMDGDE